MGLSLVLAAPGDVPEKAKLKVYYGESIGAGEAVYHIEACSRIEAYAPLRCSKFNAEKAEFVRQCKDKKDGKVIEGKLIKGCLTGSKDKAGYEKVDVSRFTDTGESGCGNAPEKQGFYYAPEWAILTNADKNAESWMGGVNFIDHGGLAWEQDAEGVIPNEAIKEVYDGPGTAVAAQRYRAGLCASWDLLVDGKKQDPNEPEAVKKAREELETKLEEARAASSEDIASKLIDEGCDNDNSKESVPFGFKDEPPPPPSVRCSLLNRISSDSGVGLFAQYVGALYRWAAGVVGIVAVLVMVFSGVEISMAGGDSAKLDSAKNRIMQSIIGLAILFLSALILYTINPGFFT